jgi:hypothetical protein
MAKESISDVLGLAALMRKISAGVVEPFLNPPGKGWNILDEDRAQRHVIVALSSRLCLSLNSTS